MLYFTKKEKEQLIKNNGHYKGYNDDVLESIDQNEHLFDFIADKGSVPYSLEGIDNNNGWIKIESEADLPKESGLYHVVCFGVETILEFFDNSKVKGFIHIGKTYINRYNEIGVTHYQPIQKPKPPIY